MAGELITAALTRASACSETAQPLRPNGQRLPKDRLTLTQQAVLELMVEGLQDDAIARQARDQHDHSPAARRGHAETTRCHQQDSPQDPRCRGG